MATLGYLDNNIIDKYSAVEYFNGYTFAFVGRMLGNRSQAKSQIKIPKIE
jgi:hypothetical protein